MTNTDLLERTLAHIEDHPETWNQEMWVNGCGTTFCFAGHVVNLGGIKTQPPLALVPWETIPADIADSLRAKGHSATIRTVAWQLLDISESQASMLFDPTNDIDDLRRIVGGLCANADTGKTSMR